MKSKIEHNNKPFGGSPSEEDIEIESEPKLFLEFGINKYSAGTKSTLQSFAI